MCYAAMRVLGIGSRPSAKSVSQTFFPIRKDGATTLAPTRTGLSTLEQQLRPQGTRRIALVVVTLLGIGLVLLRAAPGESPAGEAQQDFRSLINERRSLRHQPTGPSEFRFTRGVYSSPWRRNSWRVDYPKADRQLMAAVNTLVDMSASERENPVRLDDPGLRRFPFLYMLEIEGMSLTPPEVEGLGNYLRAGGFLVLDDFWGSYAFANLEREMRRVLPEYAIVEIPLDHPIFNTVYRIEEVIQVPAFGRFYRGRTSECYGCEVFTRGIFDDKGRLMVVINGNTNLGDAWEWFERREYPLQFSSFAVQRVSISLSIR